MSIKDYEGGIITKNPTTPTGPYQTGVASGVWTMDQAAEYTKQGVWPTAGNVPPYVDDVFSTYLYTGGASGGQTITNDIDLSGEGGMVWIKGRNYAYWHQLADTERGANKMLSTNSSNAEASRTQHLTSFNSDGFTVGTDNDVNFDVSGVDTDGTYASWTFRKKTGFFDVVTYTGTGSATTISHNLGTVPGVMIIKRVNDTEGWQVYHRDLATDEYLELNSTGAATNVNGTLRWNNTRPTDTEFSIGTHNSVNASGDTYVAYLFAHDAQLFGDNGDESIIKCGSFSGDVNADIDLGWEPQFLIYRQTNIAGNWGIFDVMRGMTTNGSGTYLLAQDSGAEATASQQPSPISNGFRWNSTGSGSNYIYIAIRRPMKTPTAATEVFAIDTRSADDPAFDSGFPVDMALYKSTSGSDTGIGSRLTSGNQLATNSTSAESSYSRYVFDYMDGWFLGGLGADSARYSWMFKRATGFFDVVCYTGTGSQKDESHNLGVTPELMIVKSRSNAGKWSVYESGLGIGTSNGLALNQNSGTDFNNTTLWVQAPTSSVFTLGTNTDTNGSGYTYIAYLFASLAGISKVGSYTGTGSNVDVDCGFTSGARFVLIKRAAGIGLTGDWYVYDSVRGIVSGNDPFLLINTTDAENTSTDYIDPLSSGFTVTSSAPTALNNSGDNYIFLAIA